MWSTGELGLAYKAEKFKPWKINIQNEYFGEFFKVGNFAFTLLKISVKKRAKVRCSTRKNEFKPSKFTLMEAEVCNDLSKVERVLYELQQSCHY